MLYIITEDSGSGVSFYKLMVESWFKKHSSKIKVIGCGGNRLIKKKVYEMINCGMLNSGDRVYIAYDNLTSYGSGGRDIEKLNNDIVEIVNILESIGVTVKVSKYISLEDLILSYKDLLKLCQSKKSKDKNKQLAIKIYERMGIENDNNYEVIFKDMMYNDNGELVRTLEKCLSILLSTISYDLDFDYFRVHNKQLYTCWVCNCRDKAYRWINKKNVDKYLSNHEGYGIVDSKDNMCKVEFERRAEYCKKCMFKDINEHEKRFMEIVRGSKKMMKVKEQIERLIRG